MDLNAPGSGEGPTANLAALIQVAQRYLRLIMVVPVTLAVLVGLVSYLIPREYRALVQFLPEKPATPALNGALAGVAGQLGLNLGGDAGSSTRLYADLARSRTLLERLLATPVAAGADAAPRPLIDHLLPAGGDSLDRRARGVGMVGDAVNVGTDIQTGVVRLTFDARDPRVAAQAANALVRYLSDFNLQSRQTRGRQRRVFTERRAGEAALELQGAERAMRELLEANRSLESPRLQNERARLQRQIEISQQVYLTLARELETARIEEVNDIPVLTVIDAAVPPRRAASPRRVFLVVTAWAVGLVAVVLVIAMLENLRGRAAMGDGDSARLHARLRALLERLHLLPPAVA